MRWNGVKSLDQFATALLGDAPLPKQSYGRARWLSTGAGEAKLRLCDGGDLRPFW
jgi:hypothetical protein